MDCQRIPASVGREWWHLHTKPRGFSVAMGQGEEPAQCTHSGEGTPRGGGHCVGALPGPDTVINALMAAKPHCKHALISDTGDLPAPGNVPAD